MNNVLHYKYYMHMPHLFIHWSLDGHLGYFHVLAIVNNEHCNEYWHTSIHLGTWFQFGGFIPESKIVESYANTMFVFRRNCQTDSQVATHFYIPTSNMQRFSFLCLLVNSFYVSHFSFCIVIIHIKWNLICISH